MQCIATDPNLWQEVMQKGRSLERGLTNMLYGAEMADIMERFDDDRFQLQAWRDLAVARYKLYDAVGMWLQSPSVVGATTYGQVQLSARGYIDESLVPDYYRRLRDQPQTQAPRLVLRRVGYATLGFLGLPEADQMKCVSEFQRQSLRKEDWFYALLDKKVFAAVNETGSYTLMLAEEY